MSPATQSLFLRRFGLAVATYLVVMSLSWLAVYAGELHQPLHVALIGCTLVIVSQLVLLVVFLSKFNQRFADASLTEFQVTLALTWLTWLVFYLDTARGAFLILYAPILLFGLFQLTPMVFARCSLLVLISFAGINVWEFSTGRMQHVATAVLQFSALFVMLLWLSLFAGYVYAQRQRLRQRRYALQAHQETLRGMMVQLEELAATDELTNLYNRRYFLRMAARELNLLEGETCHGLALIDLDHFKRINDNYGHAAGDQVLQAFAQRAENCLRDTDVLARYGGEEFVLLIPLCTERKLIECCERVRESYAQVKLDVLPDVSLSLSIGMTLLERGDNLDEALQRADQALYLAKRTGRNRCVAGWENVDA
ncbi:DeoR faimly transcriptional regulator [Pseudomonas syringae]|uniref:diguanylate cyclase n=2 Tax=Pseudomonas syringae TaxID=317 RepID=A0A085VP90_PSESX|nr:DeoR faimly transcriptional regulator [Pseudomonas syringae]